MKINTKVFGEIDIEEDKIINFVNGIIGFPDLKRFTLIYDAEKGVNAGIRWLQCMDEPTFALPVMDPLAVMDSYNPVVDDELFKKLGEMHEDNTLVLVSATIPKDITKMSVNLQGPFVINVDERKACQVIVDNADYPVKYYVYDILKARKGGE
ncbi:MAG: flagellar assembly protein FliW [Lachnospiraceae bacterium]|nr:flagellar assembly protein FliW [Lachnospiraceae bacterium]